MYTRDLMSISSHRSRLQAIGYPSVITTPLKPEVWKKKLMAHPDQDFVHYIIRGIETGFAVGVDCSKEIAPAKRNMQSALTNPELVDKYLQTELELGNICGPFAPGSIEGLQINRFGVIPKKHQPGKWRLITDLSYPEGSSVNDAIARDMCSMSYISVHDVANAAVRLGKGSLIAKIDIKSAYRLVPVCPQDRKWLGVKWRDHVYIDCKLPFGLRSAPKIFNALADALEWVAHRAGVDHIFHYLDDFAVVGPPQPSTCGGYLEILAETCKNMGVPLAPEKQEGPSTTITFLGIEIDSIKQELRLPREKLDRLGQLVHEWEGKKACTRQELESLIGTLQHACTVIGPGKSFLRRMITLLKVASRRHHHIRLNRDFKSDLLWWKHFAVHWNGSSLIVTEISTRVEFASNASGNWGCGAWWQMCWFQLPWNEFSRRLQIAVKELIPIIIAALLWGSKYWAGKYVVARCDNGAVVAIINSRHSKDPLLMQLLRCLFFIEAYCNFSLTAVHIPGTHNTLADDLSRNRLHSYREKMGGRVSQPTIIPDFLMQWLLDPQADWTSPAWMGQFASIVIRA